MITRLLALLIAIGLTCCTARPIKEPSQLPPDSAAPAAAIAAQASIIPAPASPVASPVQRPERTRPTLERPTRIDEIYKAKTAPAERRQQRGGPADITLNFRDAEVREVTRFVIGEVLKQNFFVDPGVAGTVTLSTNRPLRRADVLPVFEAALKSIGARLVMYQGVYRVSRDTGVPGRLGGSVAIAGDSDGAPSFVAFPMQFVAAGEMAKILAPLLPERAIAYSDTERNVILVAGDGPTLQLARDTVEIFDVNQMAGKHVLLLGLQSADARVVVKELGSIFGASGRTPGARIATEFVPIDRINAVMVLSRNLAHIEEARNWIYRLDRNLSPTERRLFVYYVQYGEAQNIATALREIVGNMVRTNSPGGGRAGNTAAEGDSAQAPPPPDDGKLTIAVDAERNALMVSAAPDQFRMIEDVLTQIDIPPLQVMIETSVFEVTLRDQLRFGIQYALSNGGLNVTDDGLFALTRGTQTAAGTGSIINPLAAPVVPGFNFILNSVTRTKLVIDALSELTEVNIISSPNILVVNNKTARLNVGDEVPIIIQNTTSAVTDTPLIVNTVEYRQTGVSLEVKPRINASGMVSMDIVQEVSDVTPTTTSTIDSPTIQNRSLLSTVTIESGETVMLGGLIRESASDGKSGLPLLHELPVLGSLFGSTAKTTRRTELVVLIRPIIIGSSDDARVVTATLKDKFLTLMQRERVGIRQPRRMH